MTERRVLCALEYDKILSQLSEYAVLEDTKRQIQELSPESSLKTANYVLAKTTEAYRLLFRYNACQIPFFEDISGELSRVEIGGILSMGELLKIASALRATRTLSENIARVDADEIVILREIAASFYFDEQFEREIGAKILSDHQMSDSASPKLAELRRTIKLLNQRIRNKLSSYLTGENSKFLQDTVVTMRGDRYVIPVKAEYRGMVRGLIHDQSSTGATLFIEPEQVVEYNNELKTALLDEQNEIQKILSDLSARVACIAERLLYTCDNIAELDLCYAKAIYAYRTRATVPFLNDAGQIRFKKGRHPLIEKDRVIPIGVNLGETYRFLLITGPNTGGKTVTMKLTGLFCAMAASGFYLPCEECAEIAVFSEIFCDIGDEQSIEQSLSTFSSHIRNIIGITDRAGAGSLVLIDEIGAGTDPEEGSAIALAVVEKLLSSGCAGIITTHYSKLKEFAMTDKRIENASMDFDAETYAPLYRLNIGTPGTSNAIEIARRLGLEAGIVERATEYLSDRKISFENVLREAERARHSAEETQAKAEAYSAEKEEELEQIRRERKLLQQEREKIQNNAKTETRKIISERVAEADELLSALEALLVRQELTEGDLISARTMRNKIENNRYFSEEAIPVAGRKKANLAELKRGSSVYIQGVDKTGLVEKISNPDKIFVRVNGMELVTKIDQLFLEPEKKEGESKRSKPVHLKRPPVSPVYSLEINIIGMTVSEGVKEVEALIDRAVVSGQKEIKIIHGFGTGRLRAGVWQYLKGNRYVDQFRGGRYGEGEMGVTVVTLK